MTEDVPRIVEQFGEEMARKHGIDTLPTERELAEGRLRLVALSQIPRRVTELLLSGLAIVVGAVNVLCGQQGIGKGLVLADIAARVTHQGRGVIFLSAEDSAAKVIRPRMEAAGADLDRVFIVTATRREDLGGILLPRDMGEMARLAEGGDVRLVVLDPWTNHVEVADFDKGAVRGCLMPLALWADQQNVAVILSAHPTKIIKDDPLITIAHASAVSQVSRSGYFLVVDTDQGSSDPTQNPHRLLIHIKHNLTDFTGSVTYQIQRNILLPAENGMPEMTVGRAVETGTSQIGWLDYRERLRAQTPETDRPLTKTAETRAWLRAHLEAHEDGVERSTVIEAGEAAGFAERTIEKVAAVNKEDGLVESLRPPGADATVPVRWRLRARPADPPHENRTAGRAGRAQRQTEHAFVRENDALPHEQAVPPVPPVPPSAFHEPPERDGDPSITHPDDDPIASPPVSPTPRDLTGVSSFMVELLKREFDAIDVTPEP